MTRREAAALRQALSVLDSHPNFAKLSLLGLLNETEAEHAEEDAENDRKAKDAELSIKHWSEYLTPRRED